jgi:hypothetical protein
LAERSGREGIGPLPLLTVGTEAKEFQGVKQGLKALQVGRWQLQAMDGAVGQPQGAAAIHTGEMVLIPFRGGKQGLTAGEMATTHQPALLELAQMAIDGGQTHGPLPRPQTGMEILAGEFIVRLSQHRQQVLLAGGQRS